MTSRERILFTAGESAVAALMVIGGLLILGSNGFVVVLGIVLIFFGAMALGHAVAIGLGLLTPSYRDQTEAAALGLAVLGQEGASAAALSSAGGMICAAFA